MCFWQSIKVGTAWSFKMCITGTLGTIRKCSKTFLQRKAHTHIKNNLLALLPACRKHDKLDFIAFNINSKKALNINQILAKQQS